MTSLKRSKENMMFVDVSSVSGFSYGQFKYQFRLCDMIFIVSMNKYHLRLQNMYDSRRGFGISGSSNVHLDRDY